MAARRNNCVPEIWLLLIGVNAIIEREESRKTNEEINSIKCRTYGVGRMAIFEGVVRKRTDRQSFHECREIRQYRHNADKQDLSADPCLKRRHNLAKAGVGKYMIGREVEMCCEVEGYWYVVEPVRGLEKRRDWEIETAGRSGPLVHQFSSAGQQDGHSLHTSPLI